MLNVLHVHCLHVTLPLLWSCLGELGNVQSRDLVLVVNAQGNGQHII